MRTAGFCPPEMLTNPRLRSARSSARAVYPLSPPPATAPIVDELSAKRQHRRIRRIRLAVYRRRWQVRRQIALRRVDRACTSCSATSIVQVQLELHHDDRRSAGADRRHLAQPRNLAELPLQRRRHRRRHYLGLAPGYIVSTWMVDSPLWQRRHRVAGSTQRRPPGILPHQQCCRNRAKNNGREGLMGGVTA